MKWKVKTGDEVVVISGAHKGARGKVLQVLKTKERVVVEGVAMRKHHKPQQQGDESSGGIQEREGSIHYSNIMKADRYDAKSSS